MKKDELYSKLQKVDKTMLKRMGMSLEELKYLQKKVLNDQLGLKLNFSEMDNEEKYNYLVLSEEKDLSFNVKDGEKSNLLIEGDNYHALKALKTAGTKVDVIYIDPPYNTGNEFIYNDSFKNDPQLVTNDDAHKHSKWLSFMRKRIVLARELMNDNAVIYVSIDDNEQAYIKVLMDEIFGESNFISSLVRDLGKDGQKTVPFFNEKHDYVLVYAKSINSLAEFTGVEFNSQSYSKENEYLDVRGPYHNKLTLDTSGLSWNKSLDYPLTSPDGTVVYAGPSTLSNEERNDMALKRLAGGARTKDWCWRWSNKNIEGAIKDKWLEWNKTKNGWQLKQNLYLDKSFDVKNNLVLDIVRSKKSRSILEFSSKDGTNSLNTLGLKFSYPKPENLIKFLINQYAGKDALVLDFFAGSGTTGQAVLEANEKDGGERRFILITNNENNIARDITRERIYRVVYGIGSKGESIKWEYSKDKKSLNGNSLKYLVVKPVDKYEGDFEEIDVEKDLYKVEFDKDIDITDFK